MDTVPTFLWLVLALGLVPLGVFGLRGLATIHDAIRQAELDRLAPPPHWLAARALCGVLLALPVVLLTRHLGAMALMTGLTLAALGYGVAPQFLDSLKRRTQEQLLDELGLHLDLIAVAMESGSSWPAALAHCMERAPEGPLRRAWQRVLRDIHSGMDALEALREFEQRQRLPPLTTLVNALRAAEKLKLPAAGVLRDRARHCAAGRFARAERLARAAPLKLWAAMLLCLAPCTALVLAFPLAQLLARLAD